MAVTATQLHDSISIGGLHVRLTGLASGKNSVNIGSLVPTWPAGYVPQGVLIIPVYDGTNAVASKFQYTPGTLSATNVDVYCDATGSLSCDLFVY